MEGRLQTRQWNDKDGTKRYTTEVKTNRVTLLGGAGRGPGAGDLERAAASMSIADETPMEPMTDDDVPF